MPTYEYECAKCGKRLEVFQSITSPPKRSCPACKGRLKRLISAGAGMIFKGSGFYITDYRSKNYKDGAKKESAATAPAAKAESKSVVAKAGGTSK